MKWSNLGLRALLIAGLLCLPARADEGEEEYASEVNGGSDCGYLKSLRMETIGTTSYAVVITSSPRQLIGSTLVGMNDLRGGLTYIPLPADHTEKALVWASLDRALHNPLIRLYWKKASTPAFGSLHSYWKIHLKEWVLGAGL